MGINENAKHAKCLVVLDKPHPAHIRGEIIDVPSPLQGSITVVQFLEIEHKVFHLVESLIPPVHRLDVHGANVGLTVLRACHALS